MFDTNRKTIFSKNRNSRFGVGAVAAFVSIAILYALPNFWKDTPAVVLSNPVIDAPLPDATELTALLQDHAIPTQAVRERSDPAITELLFDSIPTQIKAREVILERYANLFAVDLNLLSTAPPFFDFIYAGKLTLGLDLQGGVHFLMKISSDELLKQYLLSIMSEVTRLLQESDIHDYQSSVSDTTIQIFASNQDEHKKISDLLFRTFGTDVTLDVAGETPQGYLVTLALSDDQVNTLKKNAIEQNVEAINNRVNEIGVSEPLVQRQGYDRILVQLPGVQDIARAKKILGSTASLEFRLVANPQDGILFYDRAGQPTPLRPQIIVSGESIVDAIATIDSTTGEQIVSVRLDGPGARKMEQVTVQNLQKPMAVVFKEQSVDGALTSTIVSIATIRDVLSSRFQISGLTKDEARDLALYLRSGALRAPMDIIEEKTIGPSLGAENIQAGIISIIIGMIAITSFMVFYYRFFGFIAITSLVVNLTMTLSILSLFGATLTLPGIAGILLNLGMAVDSNILIHERIKEELQAKRSLQESIYYGYNRVFITIIDSNVTTLIAVLFLFALGSGPVRGFAVTISVGALATVFCAVTISRMLVNASFNNRKELPAWAI